VTDTRHARVVVASTRAAQGLAEDRTGPVIRDWLLRHRFLVPEPVVVADGRPVADAVGSSLEARVQVVITTGGTGVSPTDRTVEAVGPLLDLPVPGIIEEIRRRGAVATPTALLTRGVAGFAGSTFLVTLPGSPGGVRDGLEVLDPLLEHMLAQHAGTGDHPTG
jgi:molybdenum cofactor synthesis domain-containing protein